MIQEGREQSSKDLVVRSLDVVERTVLYGSHLMSKEDIGILLQEIEVIRGYIGKRRECQVSRQVRGSSRL